MDVKDKRSVIFVGHSGAGKTSVIDAMLYKAGANTRHGSVDDGSSLCDYDPEEIERRITIKSKVMHITHNNKQSYLIDTPGYADFIGSVIAPLRGVDSGVCVVCGVSGVEVGTERSWALLAEKGLARFVFINRLDKEHSDFQKALDSVRNGLDKKCVPLEFPVGKETSLSATVSLLSKESLGKLEGADKEVAEKYRESLIESIAEVDDALVEKYLGGEELTEDEIKGALRKGVVEGSIFPVFCGSSTKEIGIESLINAIETLLPSPLDRPDIECKDATGENAITKKQSKDEPFSALVIQSLVDPYIGQLTVFRVFSGALKSDSSFYNVTKDSKERIGQLFILQGKEQKPVSEVSAGDIAAVAKLKETAFGDTLSEEGAKVRFNPIVLPEPAISLSVKPKSRHDEEKIMTALAKLTGEDPTFKYGRDQQTKELIVSGVGDMHLNVMMGKLKSQFKVEVEIGTPKVAYKETIKKPAKAHEKYKKQSGGHGQYGEVYLEVEPLPRGEGFEFVDKIVGGSIPKQYIPAVEKGIKEAMLEGALAGYPIVDLRAILYDGSFHTVDSSEMAFKIAGRMAFRKGMLEGTPVLLEPIMDVEITVSDDVMGNITGDINSRRGKIMGMESKGTKQIVKAQVPLAEILKYATDLRSMTAGKGSYSMKFSHYEEVPGKQSQIIVAAYKKAKEEHAAH